MSEYLSKDEEAKGYLREIFVAVCSVLITGLIGGGIYLLIERSSSLSPDETRAEIDKRVEAFYEQRIKPTLTYRNEVVDDKFVRLFSGLENYRSIDVDVRQLITKIDRCETMIQFIQEELKKKDEEGQ